MIKKQITQKAYLRECTDFARLATEAFKETPDYPKRKINKCVRPLKKELHISRELQQGVIKKTKLYT